LSLSPQEVARLAELARIELTAAEQARLAGQLDVILGAVAAVTPAARADVQPTSHALPLVNVFRPDTVSASLPQADALAMAPAQEDGRFRVPRILEEEA
jgi:aspartyl-tRNA(Asn)/glutamyl-tRNA(Gln) amidotransferase subunit C